MSKQSILPLSLSLSFSLVPLSNQLLFCLYGTVVWACVCVYVCQISESEEALISHELINNFKKKVIRWEISRDTEKVQNKNWRVSKREWKWFVIGHIPSSPFDRHIPIHLYLFVHIHTHTYAHHIHTCTHVRVCADRRKSVNTLSPCY